MITDLQTTQRELDDARRRLAELEAEVNAQMKQELAALPSKYGFSDIDSFIAAVREASPKRRGRRPGSKASKAVPGGARRRRGKVTDETRQIVKKLVAAGKTGSEIAEVVGVSLPTVQNIKKSLGLVKPRR